MNKLTYRAIIQKEDILNIKSLRDLYVFTDKTNIYKLPPQDYKRLLHENITKSYKKSPTRLEKSINLEAKEIAAGVKLDDRIEYGKNISLHHTERS